jgi:succinate dehydrogenase/fumarate reductase flavoprotein subunit
MNQTISCDVLVIGGGGTGLRAAIEAKKSVDKVVLASKGEAGRSGSTMYSGCSMIATLPTDPEEAFKLHYQDTMFVGKFLNDPRLVEALVNHAGESVLAVEQMGVKLHKKKGGFLMGRPDDAPNPSAVEPDYAGYEFQVRGAALTQPLRRYADQMGVQVLDGIDITRLIVKNGEAAGATGIHVQTGDTYLISTKAVVLASGGAGQLYALTSNSWDITGDSYSLALEAGVTLRDMEFVEFNPCRLLYPSLPTNLPPDLFSYGAVLRNAGGERFILKHNPKGEENSFREEMPRLLYQEVKEGRGVQGGIFLDATPIPLDIWETRYPALFEALKAKGVNPQREYLIFGVRANMFAGGVKITAEGESNIPGLFAAGEAAGGIHGAKRFGGNSVAHTLVSGSMTGRASALHAQKRAAVQDLQGELLPTLQKKPGNVSVEEVIQHLQKCMWEDVSFIRSEPTLQRAKTEIQSCKAALENCKVKTLTDWLNYINARGMCLAAEVITVSALYRKESRGPHYREDYLAQDKAWLGSIEANKVGSDLLLNFKPKT